MIHPARIPLVFFYVGAFQPSQGPASDDVDVSFDQDHLDSLEKGDSVDVRASTDHLMARA